MRMGFLFTGLFWGIVVIFIGISIILKATFKIDIPVFRIIFGLILLYWGVRILFGVHGHGRARQGASAVFSEGRAAPETVTEKEYTAVFGSYDLDLRKLKLQGEVKLKANAVFGSMNIALARTMPVRISSDGVFSGVEFPQGGGSSFGSSSYQTKDFDGSTNRLVLEINTVFGSTEVKYRD